jgi:hypothetical protein
VAAHLVCLPLCLLLGFVVCGEDLGWSDSLWLTQPGASPVAYVARWYRGLNGRLAQAIVASLAALPLSSSPTPESLPFWIFAGLSFFCTAMAPVLIGASLARAAGSRLTGVAAALLLLAVWSTNPVVFEWATYHHFAIFIDYLLPTYLAALWFSHALALASRDRPSRPALALHGLGYVFLSNWVEVFLLSLPLLALLALAVGRRSRPLGAGQWLRASSVYAVLSAVAAFVYWISPGQRTRAAIAGMALPEASSSPLAKVRDLVATEFFGLASLYGKLAYGLALLVLLGALVGWIRRFRLAPDRDKAARSATWGLAGASAVLFVAHALAMIPALLVPVVARVVIYPGLLLLTSLALLLLAAASALGASRRRLLLAGVAALALGVAAVQLRRCAELHAERQALFALRRSVYEYVLGVHRYSGRSAFVLTDCNLAPRGETIEPPWGLQAYFSWKRRPPLRVYIDTNEDFSARPPLDYATVSCRRFLRPSPDGEVSR